MIVTILKFAYFHIDIAATNNRSSPIAKFVKGSNARYTIFLKFCHDFFI